MLSPFVSQKMGLFASKEKGEDLVVLKELIEAGKVTPVIGATFPLSDVPDAMRHLEAGHAEARSSSPSEGRTKEGDCSWDRLRVQLTRSLGRETGTVRARWQSSAR